MLLVLLTCTTSEAGEIPCGAEHVVQPGETLSRIALKAYGDRFKWPAIVSANEKRLASGRSLIAPGQKLLIPCIKDAAEIETQAAEPVLTPAEVLPDDTTVDAPSAVDIVGSTDLPEEAPRDAATEVATLPKSLAPSVPAASTKMAVEPLTRIGLLTPGNLVPFADRALPNGGLVTELLERALQSNPRTLRLPRQLYWIGDRSSHQQLLGRSVGFDVSFPWERPDCEHGDQLGPAARELCQRFLFTEPFLEEMDRLFVLRTSNFAFRDDAEIIGRRICGTANMQIEALDANGRRWVSDDRIVFFRASQLECFRMLQAKEIDAVYTTDLAGVSAINMLELTKDVKALERPVAITLLSAIVARNHPHATEIVNGINDGLAALHESGEYDDVVSRHLEEFWKTNSEN
jgi:polar amino acid transport system substrate-binding protein